MVVSVRSHLTFSSMFWNLTARVGVGASAGVVPLAGKTSPAAIVDAADKAMYARKKERRG